LLPPPIVRAVGLAWQGGFQEHCIRLYPQAQLLKEAGELVELEHKIDHLPNGGTKDTSDAASGAFFSAITSEEIRSLSLPQAPPVVLGISPTNASPEDPFGISPTNASQDDPFGLFARIKPRRPRVYNA
jgi:hypothetical protein